MARQVSPFLLGAPACLSPNYRLSCILCISPSLPSSPQIFFSTHCGVGTVLDTVAVNKTDKTALGAYIQAGGSGDGQRNK